MAGIGFRLQHLFQSESYIGQGRALAYAAVISSGPWLLSVLAMAAVPMLAADILHRDELAAYRAIIVLVYAISLIATGPIHLASTRYVADVLYSADVQRLGPTYRFLAMLTSLGSTVLGFPIFLSLGLDMSSALAATAALGGVSLTWIGMIFLSAAKDYVSLVWVFAIGYGATVGISWLAAQWDPWHGLLWAFAGGQLLLAALLGARIQIEFPSQQAWDAQVVRHWRLFPALLALGLVYNLGIWIDKFAFWWGPAGESVLAHLAVAPRYDACVFIAYLTIVPSTALFLLHVEVVFYRRYAAYYAAIAGGESLQGVRRREQRLRSALQGAVASAVVMQGAVTTVCYMTAPQWMAWLELPPDLLATQRLCLLAAVVQSLLHTVVLIMLYFDWRLPACIVGMVFCGVNLLGSVYSQAFDERFWGMGYLAACVIALIIAYSYTRRGLSDLERYTFTSVPMRL